MNKVLICIPALFVLSLFSPSPVAADVVTVPCVSDGGRWRYIGLENNDFPIVLLKSHPWMGEKTQHPMFQPWMDGESPLTKRTKLSVCAVATAKSSAWNK